MPPVDDLLAKADQAHSSALILLASDDIEGACNRAYYAMFHAARAALISIKAPEASSKTHSGVIAAFGLHLVKDGPLEIEHGRALNHAEHLRVIADYRETSLDIEDISGVVVQAGGFVRRIREFVRSG